MLSTGNLGHFPLRFFSRAKFNQWMQLQAHPGAQALLPSQGSSLGYQGFQEGERISLWMIPIPRHSEWESELPDPGWELEAEESALLLVFEGSREIWLLCGADLGGKELLQLG